MKKLMIFSMMISLGTMLWAQTAPQTPPQPEQPEQPASAESSPASAESPEVKTYAGDSVDISVGNIHIRVQDDGDEVDMTVGNWNLKVDEQGNVSIGENEDEEEEEKLKVVETKYMLIDLGVSTWLNDGSFNLPEDQRSMENLNYWRSANVDLYLFRQRISLIKQVLNIEYGLGFSWNLYNFRDDVSLMPKADYTDVLVIDEPLKKSRLTTTHLTMPLLLMIETNPRQHNRSFRIGAGPYGALRTGSKTVYKTENHQKVKNKDDFNLNPLRWGVQGRIGFGSFNLFVNYAVTEMFREGQGPELNPIAFGLTIHGF